MDTNLSAAIAELPRTLAVGRPALGALNAALPSLRRLSDELRPAVRSTGPMIDASLPFIRQLRGLVQPAELRGLVADLRPPCPTWPSCRPGRCRSTSRSARLELPERGDPPWTHQRSRTRLPGQGRGLYESTKFLPGIAEESTAGDGNGQWFRVLGGGGTNSYALGSGLVGNSLNPIEGQNPPKPKSRPPIRPNAPCENQQTPDLRTNSSAGPKAVDPGTGGLPPLPLPLPARKRLAKSRLALMKEVQQGAKARGLNLKIQKAPATKSELKGGSGR